MERGMSGKRSAVRGTRFSLGHCTKAVILTAAISAGCASCDTKSAAVVQQQPSSVPDSASDAVQETAEPERCIQETSSTPAPEAHPADECPEDSDGPIALAKGVVRFPDAPSAPEVTVQLAGTAESRQRGLMYVTSMESNAGMLFSWPEESIRSFWMRNTCIPLDMLFIAQDETIVGILEQVPVLNDAQRRVPCAAMHVLEVNAGWTREHGVVAGQKVTIGK
jgi:uncharacterized membrane protein (UPF0127 family)